jgi:putative flippase GtrA
MIITYIMSVVWVFQRRSDKSMLVEFGLFAVIGVVGLAINSLILGLLTQKLHVFDLFAKVVAAAIVYIWNFFVRKYLLFSGGERQEA